jgi:hypothetical protein
LSGLPVFVDRQYVEESRHQQLLAVHELWRDLERVAP